MSQEFLAELTPHTIRIATSFTPVVREDDTRPNGMESYGRGIWHRLPRPSNVERQTSSDDDNEECGDGLDHDLPLVEFG